MSFPLCGARSKGTGKPCQNIAGKGTDHVGNGTCRLHGGGTPIRHGLYSKIHRTRLGKRIAEIENDPEILSLHRELATLKALAEEAAENYQKHDAALLAWHRAESPAYQKLIKAVDAEEVRDAVVELRSLDPKRPNQCPDAELFATLVREIGRAQDRIRKAETVVTSRQMVRVYDRMAGVVAQFTDPAAARKIRDAWMNLPVEGR